MISYVMTNIKHKNSINRVRFYNYKKMTPGILDYRGLGGILMKKYCGLVVSNIYLGDIREYKFFLTEKFLKTFIDLIFIHRTNSFFNIFSYQINISLISFFMNIFPVFFMMVSLIYSPGFKQFFPIRYSLFF